MERSKEESLAFSRFGFAALCLLISAALVAIIASEAYDNLTARPVSARVTSVSVETHKGRRGRLLYSPAVTFAYRVDGTEYESGRYRAEAGPADTQLKAERLAAAYHVGQGVTVFVPTRSPSAAFLRRETVWDRYGMLLLIIGIWFALRGRLYPDKHARGSAAPGTRAKT